MRKGFLLRSQEHTYIQYGEDAKGGIELFDLKKDPNGYTNLVDDPAHAETVTSFRKKMDQKLVEVRGQRPLMETADSDSAFQLILQHDRAGFS